MHHLVSAPGFGVIEAGVSQFHQHPGRIIAAGDNTGHPQADGDVLIKDLSGMAEEGFGYGLMNGFRNQDCAILFSIRKDNSKFLTAETGQEVCGSFEAVQ